MLKLDSFMFFTWIKVFMGLECQYNISPFFNFLYLTEFAPFASQWHWNENHFVAFWRKLNPWENSPMKNPWKINEESLKCEIRTICGGMIYILFCTLKIFFFKKLRDNIRRQKGNWEEHYFYPPNLYCDFMTCPLKLTINRQQLSGIFFVFLECIKNYVMKTKKGEMGGRWMVFIWNFFGWPLFFFNFI